jgi:DNA replication protein DnaC
VNIDDHVELHRHYYSVPYALIREVIDARVSDLLEILEDRYGSRSTIVTSQLPPAQWHDHIGEPTLADAICDRLLHNAHRIVLKGPSRRKEGKLDS